MCLRFYIEITPRFYRTAHRFTNDDEREGIKKKNCSEPGLAQPDE